MRKECVEKAEKQTKKNIKNRMKKTKLKKYEPKAIVPPRKRGRLHKNKTDRNTPDEKTDKYKKFR